MQNQTQKPDNQELMKLPTLEVLQNKLSQTVIKSINQAVNSDFLSLARMKKNYGELQTKALVVDMLVKFIQFINVGKTMNADQVAETVQMIEGYFPHLNLADLKLFFNQMKLGYYGKFYDRIDGMVILENLEQYNQERMNVVESINTLNHTQLKKDSFQTSLYHPDVVKAMKEAVSEKSSFNIEKTEILISKEQVSMCYITQRWLKQFDNLYKKFGVSSRSVRIIRFGDQLFSLEEFIEIKIKNYKQ